MWNILRVAPAHFVKQKNLILVHGEMRPERKRTCVFHESGHGVIPWHIQLNYACTENAFEPIVHRLVEREAFTCGAEIQMPRHLFIPDAMDLPLGIEAIKILATRYAASLETTAIRYAQIHRRICAIVMIEPSEPHRPTTTANGNPPNQLSFSFRDLLADGPAKDQNRCPLRVKYSACSPGFRKYIHPGTGIAEGTLIFEAWDTGIARDGELPASVFGSSTQEVYCAEIFPLGQRGKVMVLLLLSDHQLVLHTGWEVVQ